MHRPTGRRLALLVGLAAGGGLAALGVLASTGSAQAAGTCSIYWTGAASSSWNATSNWSLADGGASSGTVPSATDFVCMSTAPTRSAVVAPSASRAIAGIRFATTPSVTPSLTLQGGTFSVNTNDSVVNNLTYTGTLNGSAALTLTGTAVVNGGASSMSGGPKTLDAAASLAVNTDLTVGAGTAAAPGKLVVNGAMTVNVSTVYLSTAPNTGTATTMPVAGSLNLVRSSVQPTGSGPLKPSLVLTGAMTTSAAGPNTGPAIGVPFTDNGTVTVNSGYLTLQGGNVASTTDTGTYAVAAGATLDLAGGTRTVSSGTVTGSGQLSVSGAAVTFGSGVALPNLLLTGGTISGSPTVGVLTATNGTASGTGTMTVTGSGSTLCTLTLNAGYKLLNQGSMSYDSGCGYLVLNGGSVFENAGTFAATGTANGYIYDDNGAADGIVNDAGATMTVGLSTINAGLQIQTHFTNNGTVSVTQGRLVLQGGNLGATTDSGTYSLASGTVLNLAAGTRTVNTGTVTGTGQLVAAGGTVTFGSGVSLPGLTVSGATIAGSPTVGVLTFTGGTLTGAGTMTVTGTGSTLCSPNIDSGYKLLNQGSMSYDSGCGYFYLSNGGQFENAGTFAVTGTAGPYIYDDNVATDGITNDAGATMTVGLNGANNALQIRTDFTDNGTVSVTQGRLLLQAGNLGASTDTGTYSLAAGTVLNLAAGTRTVNTGTVTGAGQLITSGGTVTFGTGVSLPGLTVSGATIAGSPTVGVLTFTGGTLTGNGTMTVTGTGSTLCSPNIDSGYKLLNQGSMSYDSGCGYFYLSNGGQFENAGTFAVTGTAGPYIYDDNVATDGITNDAGATMTVGLNGANNGLQIRTNFTNNGTVTVTLGRLVLQAGNLGATTDNGTYSLASGTVLNLAAGTRTVNSGTVTGAGQLITSGGTVTFGTGVSLATLTVSGAAVSGSPTVGVLTFIGGTLTGNGTMTVTGSGSTLCSANIDSAYRLLNQGSMAFDTGCGYVYLSNGGQFENAGTFAVTGTGNTYVYDDGTASDKLVNDAGATITLTLSTGTAATSFSTNVTNTGTVTATKGTLSLPSISTLSSTGALTGGTWLAGPGTLRFPRTVTSNSAAVTIASTGAINLTSSSASAFTALATNSGSFSTGVTINGTASLTNTGTLAVTAGTWRVSTFTQTAGTTTIASGAVLRSGTSGTANVAVNGGTLSGSGTVQGVLTGLGTVAPGTAGSGTLTVTGPYTMAAASTLAVTVGAGSTTVTASAAATLAGTLSISTVGPLPAVGTSFTVASGASRTGTFAQVVGQDVPAGNAYWAVAYTSTGATLTLTAYPQVSTGAVSTPEGAGGTTALTFPVTLSAPSPLPVTVAYSTSDGTAVAPGDYTATSGTLTFAPGTTSLSVPVTVNGDTLYEADETLTLTLATPTGATLGTATATGTIVNDDAAPTVSVADAGGTVDSTTGATITFPVTLSAVSGLPVTVAYSTSDGTATSPADFTATSGTLTVPAGSTSGSVTVTAVTQPGYAPPKTFTLTLASPTGATLGTSTATGTITNGNAVGGTPTLTSVSPSLAAQASTVVVTLTGTNLDPSSIVTVSGTGVTVSGVTVVNSARITATFTVASTAVVGARDVVVTATGLPTATCTGCFQVTARPTATATSRSAFAAGNVDAIFTVTGTNFQAGTTVRFVKTTTSIDTTSVTVTSGTSLTASISLAAAAKAGAYNLVVSNPDGGVATCTGCVTVFLAPKITSVGPTSIARGTSTTVTLTGSGFVAGALVSVANCTLTNVVVVNATTITATVTPNGTATAGTKTVKVFDPATAGSGTATKAAAITIT